jgi:hypothetical protein
MMTQKGAAQEIALEAAGPCQSEGSFTKFHFLSAQREAAQKSDLLNRDTN